MTVLKIEHLTKDYGNNRGIFDVSFNVEKGEVYGFLGPNGAGKTTTIRHIMGFSKPQKGNVYINGLDCFKNSSTIQKELGYLPGEISPPDSLTGTEFINMMSELHGLKDRSYINYLINIFELDPSGKIKRMSLGMKRKLAIVTAFMHDPEVLILDEPTSGLDPIMQNTFIEFIKKEKERGKTILLSSHIFEEIDATCDKISIIKEGKLISTFLADELRHNERKVYKIELNIGEELDNLITDIGKFKNISVLEFNISNNQAKIQLNDNEINNFIEVISKYDLNFISEIKFTLEDYFMKFYDRDIKS